MLLNYYYFFPGLVCSLLTSASVNIYYSSWYEQMYLYRSPRSLQSNRFGIMKTNPKYNPKEINSSAHITFSVLKCTLKWKVRETTALAWSKATSKETGVFCLPLISMRTSSIERTRFSVIFPWRLCVCGTEGAPYFNV